MWLYNGKELTDDQIGDNVAFVYLITNLKTNKQYIGKKIFQKTRSKVVKGKTRKKKIRSESDWRTYYGSNNELKEDVVKLGAENFKREILYLCKSKGTANYLEAKEQMLRAVLEKPDDWYNEQVRCRVHRSHLKL
jgi:hypothetical protein